jgi:hypothetical protein
LSARIRFQKMKVMLVGGYMDNQVIYLASLFDSITMSHGEAVYTYTFIFEYGFETQPIYKLTKTEKFTD